ncbi:DUF4136 domain-containing protein [Galbibacter sp. EGI 63066]|uniref:DUF4136 domain-containing protein n=1 Tax=Galbibacter sp. EGI 63066 TaxID=2993559 RepID=UPI002249226C|nr:DUF4136 domain-containing protein [Galbibacter sp. EGI 63066]MCX2679421.1 DUF4136 domain-containing protein [Galbibacter sp. EGI 63066]
MKIIKQLTGILVIALMMGACTSVRVATDYDRKVDFGKYKTFAFYKPGIDKADISDLDKKRILRSIQYELTARGYQLSENPDILVSIFTTEVDRVSVYNNMGWGWGWYRSPFWGGYGYNNVSTQTEGSLYIDLIDAGAKELVWQGKGTGHLITNGDITKKEERIHEFVKEILAKFPPMATSVAVR